jgi:hypothetical protein
MRKCDTTRLGGHRIYAGWVGLTVGGHLGVRAPPEPLIQFVIRGGTKEFTVFPPEYCRCVPYGQGFPSRIS